MPVQETSRQYLPDLENRWKLSRRKILELSRDGILPLWIHLINVKLLRLGDGSKELEWTPHAEINFFGTSLHQLCENTGKGNGFLSHLYCDGEECNAMGGALRDDCKVLVFKVPEQDNPHGEIYIDYQKVFAFVDDVKRLDKEFSQDGEEHHQRPPYLDPGHKHYSEELALAVEVWMDLFNKEGKFNERQAHKKQIENLLKQKRESLTQAAKERIATLVRGGSVRSDSFF